MAASDTPVGMDHPTTVPENFHERTDTCAACGEPLDDHEA